MWRRATRSLLTLFLVLFPLVPHGHSLERRYYVDIYRVSAGYPYYHLQALTVGISSYQLNVNLTTSVFETGEYFKNDEVFVAKSLFPLYLSFSPYHRLVKPSREWTIARPMLYLFAGGSAWGSEDSDSKYLRIGSGFLWTAWLGDADDHIWNRGPMNIGVELGWILLETSKHHVSRTREDLGPGSYSSLYGGFTLSFSGWLSPTALKKIKEEQEEREARIEEEETTVEEMMAEFSSPGRIHVYWSGRIGYGNFHKFELKDRDGSQFWYSDAGKIPQATAGVLAIERDRSTLGLDMFWLDSRHMTDWDPDEREISFWLFALFARQRLLQSSFLSLAPRVGVAHAWMQGEDYIPGSGIREREYTVGRSGFGVLVGAKSRLQKQNGAVFAWKPFLDAEWDYISSLDGLYSGTYSVGFSFQGIEDVKTVMKRFEAGLFFNHVTGSEVGLSTAGLCILLYFR